MATIRERKNKDGSKAKNQWQAIIEMKDRATGLAHKESRTFETRTEARDWAKGVEADLQRGLHKNSALIDTTTLRTLIEKYISEVSPKKLGSAREIARLKKWLTFDLADRPISRCLPTDFSAYIAKRRSDVSRRNGPVAEQTIKLEIIAISNVFEAARKDWGYDIQNPIKNISKPKGSNTRETRITHENWKKIAAILLNKGRNPLYITIAELAIETGMRQDELFRMTWEDVEILVPEDGVETPKRGKVIVEGKDTSTTGARKKRVVPLSPRAITLLESLPRPDSTDAQVFQSVRKTSKDGLSRAFTAACADIGLIGGCFHSTRHEAASRMAPHYPMLTLMKIFGWKTPSMAARYYHASDEELYAGIDKMNQLSHA
ncbi:MAG: site-specific integrase [Gallionella sp.]